MDRQHSARVRVRKRRWACTSEETAMHVIGAVFQPELIELMKAVLDDAAAMLPEAKRTSTMKAEIASHILACAAKGERNPTALKIAALCRRGLFSLFALYLSGAQSSLRHKKPPGHDSVRPSYATAGF